MGEKLTRRDFSALMAGLGVGVALPALGKSPHSMPFRLGIITDEIGEDFGAALDFISQYSLQYCEVRDLWKKNVMNVSREDLDRAKGLIEKHKLHVSDIASPIFKYNLPEVPAVAEKSDMFGASFTDKDSDKLLAKSFELADFFGTKKVRIFAYLRVKPEDAGKAYPIIRERLAKAAEKAKQSGIILVLENEHTCNVGTGKELGRILRDVNSPNLRGNWDPGNATMLGEVPYPDGYLEVKGLFAHMHAKDSKREANGKMKWMPVGGGMVDWKGQIKALREDHYEGTISLETHYRRPDGNKMESTRESLEGLLKIIKETA
jgi:sugar phosphate isomerase/epimerase